MVARKFLSITLVIILFLSPTISHADYSWQGVRDWALQLFNINKESAEKFMPFALFSMGAMAMGSIYYWMNKKTTMRKSSDRVQLKKAPINLKQFNVYSQTNSDGGGYASCGYQTLLRAMQVVKSKSEGEDETDLQKTLNDSTTISVYFGSPAGQWSKEIIKLRKNQALKKDIHARLLAAAKSTCDSKAKNLYVSALGFLEDTVIAIANNPVAQNQSYEFTDEAIVSDLAKSLETLKNKENEDLIDKLKTSEAIKNCFNLDKMRTNCLSKEFILGLPALIKTIEQKPELQSDFQGDWLSDGEIEYIWEHHKRDIIPNDVACGFKAIANFDLVGNPDIDPAFDEVGLYVRDNIQPTMNRKQQTFQIFALGTMRQGGDTTGSRGHWYPLIMHQNKQGERQYYIMDSLSNKYRKDDTNAWKIINMIEKMVNPIDLDNVFSDDIYEIPLKM